jgi:hypothetical protein
LINYQIMFIINLFLIIKYNKLKMDLERKEGTSRSKTTYFN